MTNEEYKKILIDKVIDAISDMTFEDICELVDSHDVKAFLERIEKYDNK